MRPVKIAVASLMVGILGLAAVGFGAGAAHADPGGFAPGPGLPPGHVGQIAGIPPGQIGHVVGVPPGHWDQPSKWIQ